MTALERNEENRWSYMTKEQLVKRLEKITNPKKLKLFADMARLYGERGLLIAVNKKLRFFESNGVV